MLGRLYGHSLEILASCLPVGTQEAVCLVSRLVVTGLPTTRLLPPSQHSGERSFVLSIRCTSKRNWKLLVAQSCWLCRNWTALDKPGSLRLPTTG